MSPFPTPLRSVLWVRLPLASYSNQRDLPSWLVSVMTRFKPSKTNDVVFNSASVRAVMLPAASYWNVVASPLASIVLSR